MRELARPLPAAPCLKSSALDLVKIAAEHCLLPNQNVVAKFASAVFPTVRGSREKRMKVDKLQSGQVVLNDDNVTPRWALFRPHGCSATHHRSGWTVAHVWDHVRDPDAYTHPANLALIPEPLAALSDKKGPLRDFLRWHSLTVYGWKPKKTECPTKPQGFDGVVWKYLEDFFDPVGFVQWQMSRLKNERVRLLKQLVPMWEAAQ